MLQKNWSELIKPTKMEVNVDETNGRIEKIKEVYIENIYVKGIQSCIDL